ncbi:PLP-dependent cysteine synthase family protein [Bartonella sp. HY329]|uniref:PLP-dependent cysteine synthase family protein n=1 Tax=unclassified Bartonella TaxID=2645622 RepID=UPI0021C77CE3|nr:MULTISPECIES: PLP-dependent cysteine synthase family protein [unclassified Bartonella]UXM95704.1 PLP-dependent cysteine synthase family protein [Bartonella sp. HY329]UXN10029.1 PLP-dependent cysteine synthase family protein [Bartonella sp. HY328]
MHILEYIGNTPLVKIPNLLIEKSPPVYVKLEEYNPGGSVKTRPGAQMVWDAYFSKKINGRKILEPTGGNTGIGITLAAKHYGLDVTLVIPDNFSQEKQKTLIAYGANIILSDHKTGPGSHIRLAKEILEYETKFICLDQFSNFSNPKSHFLTTGPEIVRQLKPNNIDCFVASIGSGGTITGVAKYLKMITGSSTKIIGVEPAGCDLFNNITVAHKIEAISVGITPKILDLKLIDEMIQVDFEELQALRSTLSKEFGLFLGVSSGANILGAMKIASNYSLNSKIVTVAPDSGRSYLA